MNNRLAILLPRTLRLLIICVVVTVATFDTVAHAQDSTGTRINRFVSGTGNLLYLGAGVIRPLLGGKPGTRESLRVSDALVTSVALTEGLKLITREKRPDGSDDRDSFPSGHATAAFAVATMEAHYHPKEAWYWYGGAALVAESRVGLHRHYIHDVIAGAAVGYFTAQWQLRSSRGLLLSPIIRPETGERGVALTVRY